MTAGTSWSFLRIVIWLAFFGPLLWKYRTNKVILLGTITLGCVGLVYILGNIPGMPEWVPGAAVLLFFFLAFATVILACFYLVRGLVKKSRASSHSDTSGLLKDKTE